MITNKKVYLAPDVMFAFVDRTHQKHDLSAAFFRYFAQEGFHVYADVISVYNAYEEIAGKMSPSVAKQFLRTIFLSDVTIIYPTDSDIKGALKIYTGDRTGEQTFHKTLMTLLADKRGIPQICTHEYLHTMFGLTIFYIPI